MLMDSSTSSVPRRLGGEISEMYSGAPRARVPTPIPPKKRPKASMPVVDSRRLDNTADAEEANDDRDGPLPRYFVAEPWHENAAENASQLQQRGIETFPERGRGCDFRVHPRERGQELRHHVDDGDDALVVTEGKSSHGCEEGGEGHVGRAHEAGDA